MIKKSKTNAKEHISALKRKFGSLKMRNCVNIHNQQMKKSVGTGFETFTNAFIRALKGVKRNKGKRDLKTQIRDFFFARGLFATRKTSQLCAKCIC